MEIATLAANSTRLNRINTVCSHYTTELQQLYRHAINSSYVACVARQSTPSEKEQQ
jgi:hypothetical protein